MRRLIVWGAGELGGQVAQQWHQLGGEAIGLTRTEQRHPELAAGGVRPELGAPNNLLKPDDLLLLALPGHKNQKLAVEALAELSPPARTILISVTGYYGTQGGLINEDSPVGEEARPTSIAATEQYFRAWAGSRGVILRIGGMYRAGRGPFAAVARRRTVRPGPPNKTMALIHYEDAATAIVAVLGHPAPEPVYLTVTPPCPTRQAFYEAACQKLGLPPPEFEPPLAGPPAEFDIKRLRRDLLPEPIYPDWWAALQ